MPGALYECVLNLSEGRRREVIDQVASAADGSEVVDIHIDPDHNRSVLTLVGQPRQLEQAAVSATEQAIALIDLNAHRGEHPRLGAMDVIPFVPLEGADKPGAIGLARGCGARIAMELAVPVFFYGWAAEGRELSEVRKRAFRDLSPDLGGPHRHPSAGGSCVGARGPMVAFNVMIEGNLEQARTIARKVRQEGGGLPGVRALGFWLATRGLAQVSMNLTTPGETTMRDALAAVADHAARLSTKVLFSELVGVAPKAALGGATDEELGLREPARLLEEVLRS